MGGVTDGVLRVAWKPTTKWTYSYPWELPPGGGDVTGVGVDPKDNVWVWQRNQPGQPALFKFGPDHKLLFAVDPALTDHTMPFRGHGMGVDPEGNAWVINEWGATVKKFSPDGKLLLTIGEKGHRGDWDESKGQRLLWEPVTIGFGPGGNDVYIFEGHGDESPNDIASDDPTNQIGLARVVHLDKNGKFINQWYGDNRGPGKFNSTHGSAIDPQTGDVWVGDREDFRIVVYSANGHFLRSIQVRNLVCALHFDNHPGPHFGELYLGTGMDGQVIRIDRDGNTLEVAGGNRKGGEEGQFNEATNMDSDSKGNLVVADTQEPRATWLIRPENSASATKK
jgi:DNA-binding beta-propeller fold protein YncE